MRHRICLSARGGSIKLKLGRSLPVSRGGNNNFNFFFFYTKTTKL